MGGGGGRAKDGKVTSGSLCKLNIVLCLILHICAWISHLISQPIHYGLKLRESRSHAWSALLWFGFSFSFLFFLLPSTSLTWRTLLLTMWWVHICIKLQVRVMRGFFRVGRQLHTSVQAKLYNELKKPNRIVLCSQLPTTPYFSISHMPPLIDFPTRWHKWVVLVAPEPWNWPY